MNCPPGMKPPEGDLKAYLNQLLELAPSSLIGVTVPLEVLLGAATATESEEYKVPADSDLVIHQMHASYRSTALNTEPVLNANLTLDLQGLSEARLQNILVELKLKERRLSITEGSTLNLAALYRTPAYWLPNAPLIVPAGTILQANFTAQSVTAAIIGNDAYYGLVLTGFLIPKKT
jgi:hypothetical protein